VRETVSGCANGFFQQKGELIEMTKKVRMQYSTSYVDIDVPESATVLQYGKGPFPAIPAHPNPEHAARDALANPVGAPRLHELVHAGSKVTIAFDDPFKSPAPIKITIPAVLENLLEAGVQEEDIELVSAGGCHRKRTPLEIRDLLGPEIYDRFCPFDGGASRIRSHDCTQGNAYLGETELGDHVEYDEALVNSDLVIYAGTIVPQAFGGYAGQGTVIGLAGQRTLDSLHSYAVYKTRDVMNAEYLPEKNRYREHKLAVHAELEAQTGKRVFYIDAIMGAGGDTCAVHAGYVPELEQVQYPMADEFFCVSVPQYDLVVVGVPHDLGYDTSDNPATLGNLSQPLRMVRSRPLLREGGMLIALSQCRGIISKHRPADHEALRLFRECFSIEELFTHSERFWNDPEYLRAYRYDYAFCPKHSIFMCGDASHHWKLARRTFVAGDVVPGIIREHGLVPAPSFNSAFAMALDLLDKPNPDILVLPTFYADPKPVFDVQ